MVEANADVEMMDPQSFNPQDQLEQAVFVIPKGKSKFERIPKGPLQEVLKFLNGIELCRIICTSKRMKWVGDEDYMFRYLTLSLPFYQKHWTETWKNCYKRNRCLFTQGGFSKTKKWSYKMCPIRQFK
jgi:hypothetical protein